MLQDENFNNSKCKPLYSLDAEQSVLGALLLENNMWDKVSERISEKDFYRNEHKLLFRVITKLIIQNQRVDIITVTEAYRQQQPELEEDDKFLAYVAELARNTPSAFNVQAYADIVKNYSVRRQLLQIGAQINEDVYENKDSQAIVEEAESKLFKIGEGNKNIETMRDLDDILAETIEHIQFLFDAKNEITGIPSGFEELDKITAGLQRGELTIIAARPSMGKTTLAMNIAEYVGIREKLPVLVFSLEMPARQLNCRLLAAVGRIPLQNLRTGILTNQDFINLTMAVGLLSGHKIVIDDNSFQTPVSMRSKARKVVKEKGKLGLIVVDYIQLLSTNEKYENKTIELGEISRALKGLAKELDCPVIALSQLNRGLEQRSDKRPMMSDLRQSGSLEQDADLIIFIYRDEVYNKESPDRGTAEIIISKHRNGSLGNIRLTFSGHNSRFER